MTRNNIFNLDQDDASNRVAGLTPRERQVAERIAMGMPHEDSASELGISPKTLDVFRGKVKAKLGVDTNGVGRVWFCALTAAEVAVAK